MFEVAFSLFSNINQSACSTLNGVLNNQSDFERVLYMHHWEFPIRMLTCPIIIAKSAADFQCHIKRLASGGYY